MNKYRILKSLGIAGTITTIYNAINNAIPVLDIIIILFASLTFICLAKELKKENSNKESQQMHWPNSLNHAASG